MFFFNLGNVDYEIMPLWGEGEGKGVGMGMGMTVEEWILSKMKFSMGRHAKAEEPESGIKSTV